MKTLIELLLRHGADKTLQTKQGLTAFEYAQFFKNPADIFVLLVTDVEVHRRLTSYELHETPVDVLELIINKTNVNRKFKKQMSKSKTQKRNHI